MGGGLETFVKCFMEYDPIWVDIAYWTITRDGQMSSLRMIDEDQWPNFSTLADYDPVFPPDPNYYHPHDYVLELGVWLRDHTCRERKKKIDARKKQEREQRQPH